MGGIKKAAWLPGLALLFSGLVSHSEAAVLFAGAEYYEDGTLISSNTSSSSPAFTNTIGDYGSAAAYASQPGVLTVSAFAGTESDGGGPIAHMIAFAFPPATGAVSAIGTATWEDTITNNTGTQIDYRFLFHVNRSSIGTETGAAGDYAGLSINITLDGVSIWSAFAEMDGCALDYSSNMGTPTTGGCEADWSPFTVGLDLGTYAAGHSFTLAYEMIAFANSTNTEDYAYAWLGDPFDPQGDGIEIIARRTGTDVPAPAALGILAMGLMGIVAARRRRTA